MSNPNPFSAGGIGRVVAAPRALAAWALVGYVALFLFFAFLGWLLGVGSFSSRSAGAGFRDLLVLAMPVLAVVLAVYVAPQVAGAKLITLVALAEYAFALFFGVISLLIGLVAMFDHVNTFWEFLNGIQYLVMGCSGLALIAVAGYVSLRAYQRVGGRLPKLFTPGATASSTPSGA